MPPAAPQEAFWRRIEARRPRRKRAWPRVHASVPVRIRTASSGVVEAITNDVSLYGMALHCDRASAARMRPASGPDGPPQTQLAIGMKLTVNGHPQQVVVRGRVAHLSLVPGASADREVALGIEFTGFRAEGEEVLRRYLEQHLYPAGL